MGELRDVKHTVKHRKFVIHGYTEVTYLNYAEM